MTNTSYKTGGPVFVGNLSISTVWKHQRNQPTQPNPPHQDNQNPTNPTNQPNLVFVAIFGTSPGRPPLSRAPMQCTGRSQEQRPWYSDQFLGGSSQDLGIVPWEPHVSFIFGCYFTHIFRAEKTFIFLYGFLRSQVLVGGIKITLVIASPLTWGMVSPSTWPLNRGNLNHLYTSPGMFLQVGGCRCIRTNTRRSLYLQEGARDPSYMVVITPTNPMKNHGCNWV